MTYNLCGHCLHHKNCHESHNGKFMYCGACQKLCDIEAFNIRHKPTDLKTIIEQSLKTEYSQYIPSEIKRIAKLEKISLEELWSRYNNE